MSVSVVIPVHNAAATLSQALDSVLVQDVDGLEVIVIDDGSTDNSRRIAEHYAARDRRITVIGNSTKRGLPETLNEGLTRARHDLVARMDADDESMPGRLRHQTAFMSENPGVAAAGTWVFNMGRTHRNDRLVRLPVTPREIARTLPRENCLYHPTVVMRRSLVLAAGGYRAEFRGSEDYELWLRLSRSHDLANLPVPLLRYRLSTKGMTLTRTWHQLSYVMFAQQVHRDPELSLSDAWRRAATQLALVDRARFMSLVAHGSATELARLDLWEDALRVVWSFRKEIGLRLTISLLTAVATERMRR